LTVPPVAVTRVAFVFGELDAILEMTCVFEGTLDIPARCVREPLLTLEK